MLSLFKKTTIEPVEEVDERRQELATVKVRDIKQYLVDEYERSQKLFDQNEYLKRELEAAREVKVLYDATLVTLDTYRQRLDSQERLLATKEREKERLQRQLDDAWDELNSCKIQLTRAALTKEELREEVAAETRESIIQDIQKHKGTLSKALVIGIIQRSRKVKEGAEA